MHFRRLNPESYGAGKQARFSRLSLLGSKLSFPAFPSSANCANSSSYFLLFTRTLYSLFLLPKYVTSQRRAAIKRSMRRLHCREEHLVAFMICWTPTQVRRALMKSHAVIQNRSLSAVIRARSWSFAEQPLSHAAVLAWIDRLTFIQSSPP